MRLPGVAGRLFIASAGIVAAVVAATFLVASHSARSAAQDAERRALEQAVDLTAQLLSGRGRSLAGGARVFVQGPYFRALVAERRRDDILDQSFEAADQLGADWVFITDERGVLIAKSDEPAVSGTPMGDVPLVAGALQGRTMTGFGASGDSVLFQAVAVPIVVPGGAPVGVLVATRRLDRQAVLDVHAATNADAIFYVQDAAGHRHPAVSTLPSGTPADAFLAAARDQAAEKAARRVAAGDRGWMLQGASLTTAGGQVIGGFIVTRPEETAPLGFAGVKRSLLLGGALGLMLALLVSLGAMRHVARPARTLASAAERALEGEYASAATAAMHASRDAPEDEIAALGRAFTSLFDELRDRQALAAMLMRVGAVSQPPGSVAAVAADAPHEPAPTRLRGARAALAAPRALALTTAGARLAPGMLLADRYLLDEQVGAGGTGVVFRATDNTLSETIAIKILRPDILADDHAMRESLKHELRLTRRVSHRNVVRTHDFGVSNGVPFITMEYVPGESLLQLIERTGPMAAGAVLAIARQLFRGLAAAHDQGIVHGDLKPANVLLAPDGQLKVTDFGLASLIRRPERTDIGIAAPPRLAGAVVGTPEYMSPELLLGGVADVRSDLYAAGVVLHECLTGTTPYPGDTPRAFLARKLEDVQDVAARPSLPNTPVALQRVISALTAHDPATRPASAAAALLMLAAQATPLTAG